MHKALLSTLLLTLVSCQSPANYQSAPAQGGHAITVESRGSGESRLEARKDAIVNALRKAVGEYVESEIIIENEDIVTDSIMAFSNAESIVSSVVDSGFEGDDIWMICKVTIEPAKLIQAINDRIPHRANERGISIKPVTIESVGRGNTSREAIADASANAIRQIIGEHVEYESTVQNEKLVTETIEAFTNAESVKSEIIERTFEGERVRVLCKVTVIPSNVIGKFKEIQQSNQIVDGEALLAEVAVMRDNLELQKKTLAKMLHGVGPKLLTATLIDRSGNKIQDGRIPKDDIIFDGNQVTVAINAKISFDQERYVKEVVPYFRKVLKAIAIKHIPNAIKAEYRHNNKLRTQAFIKQDMPSFRWFDAAASKNGLTIKDLKEVVWAGSYTDRPISLKVAPRETVVLLNTDVPHTKKSGLFDMAESTEIHFDAFVIPRELERIIGYFLHVADGGNGNRSTAKAMPYIDIQFLKGNQRMYTKRHNNIRLEQQIPNEPFMLRPCCTAKKEDRFGHGGNLNGGLYEPIPFSEPFTRDGTGGGVGHQKCCRSAFVLGLSYDSKSEWRNPVFIMPFFGTPNQMASPTIVMREYATFDKDDFANLTDINITFSDWPKRSVPKY